MVTAAAQQRLPTKRESAMGIRKFFRYLLPLAVIMLSIALVVTLVAISKSKRPERKASAEPTTIL